MPHQARAIHQKARTGIIKKSENHFTTEAQRAQSKTF
jgi:hypothetical protein